jgi:hypothetical protein
MGLGPTILVQEADDINARYWAKYDWAREFADLEAQADDPKKDYRRFLPLDPTHPRAWIPQHVRWAKRKAVDFRCPITGWHELDYYQDVQKRGSIRAVGTLTMDHILPGSLGGLTTDENIRAFSELANTKKGNLTVTDEELRDRLLAVYYRVDIPADLYEQLRKYKVVQFKVG